MTTDAHDGGHDPSGVSDASIFTGFAPWIVFAVVASPSTWEFAAIAALIASVLVAWPGIRQGHYMMLDIAGIVFFAALAVLALFLDRPDLDWLERYAQVISSGALAVLVLGSLAFLPFTEQYARLSTPREIWSSPVFKKINRDLTAIWGLVFLITAILGYVGLHINQGKDWFNWVLPIALIVWAVKFTAAYPDRVTGRLHGQSAAARS